MAIQYEKRTVITLADVAFILNGFCTLITRGDRVFHLWDKLLFLQKCIYVAMTTDWTPREENGNARV